MSTIFKFQIFENVKFLLLLNFNAFWKNWFFVSTFEIFDIRHVLFYPKCLADDRIKLVLYKYHRDSINSILLNFTYLHHKTSLLSNVFQFSQLRQTSHILRILRRKHRLLLFKHLLVHKQFLSGVFNTTWDVRNDCKTSCSVCTILFIKHL